MDGVTVDAVTVDAVTVDGRVQFICWQLLKKLLQCFSALKLTCETTKSKDSQTPEQ